MISDLVLSVRLMTYNHSEFILECLNSIESQITNFNFEVIIGDDFSSDNTAELIKGFIKDSKNKHIHYKFLERGMDYKMKREKLGRLYNFSDILSNCKGKYIALIDGDDYWIDDYKLQKQVDFLESNEDFNICFSLVNNFTDEVVKNREIPPISDNGEYLYDHLIEYYDFIATSSAIYRNNFKELPEWFYTLPVGDMGLYLIVCKVAKMKCLPEIMCIYRIHDGGVWSGSNKVVKYMRLISLLEKLYPHMTSAQKNIVAKKKIEYIKIAAHAKYPKNRTLRVWTRFRLRLKYFHLK